MSPTYMFLCKFCVKLVYGNIDNISYNIWVFIISIESHYQHYKFSTASIYAQIINNYSTIK